MKVDEQVEKFRLNYPDLTPEEETALRAHFANPSGVFLFRCTFTNDGHGFGLSNNLKAGDILIGATNPDLGSRHEG